jgi:hypothetical protein
MGVDIDPQTLAIGAAASAHAAQQAHVHIGEEIKARDPSNLTALIGSLAPEGPYAYTIMPRISEEGDVALPVLTTRDEIAEAYGFIRGLSDLHEVVGLTEIAGSWYLFQDAWTVGSPKDSDVRNDRQTLGLFPSGGESGITGELVWLRVPTAQLGSPDDIELVAEDELHARKQVYDRFDQHLGGLRANDVEAILEPVHDRAASAVRDYVAGTGALVELNGKEEHRSWYRRFLDTYEIQEVQLLHAVHETWYAFAELRLTAVRRTDDAVVAFHTAEFHVTARDGRFIARVGHGTEPA